MIKNITKLETVIQSEVIQKEKSKYCILTYIYIWDLEEWYRWTCLQGSNGDTDLEDGLVDTTGGKSGTN